MLLQPKVIHEHIAYKLLVALLGAKWLSTLITISARFQEKQICGIHWAAHVSLGFKISGSLQTEGSSEAAGAGVLKG